MPDACDELAVTVEFPITIGPTLDFMGALAEEPTLEPDPMAEPPVDIAALFAVTNELKISKPDSVEDPLVEEPPPIPELMSALEVERVLASTRDSRIRMKPVIEVPLETYPIPIPEAPFPE
jgi:hypothetical protein